MQHTYTETIGVIDGVIAFLQNADNAALLAAKGYPTAARITDLQAVHDDLVSKNAEQEALKAQLKQKTAALEASLNSGWELTSGTIDAISGTLGKNSPAAEYARRIRSDVRRGPNEPEAPVPATP